MILGRPFLATANALINYRNGMMRISFGNMQRQSSGFDDMEFSTLNWVENLYAMMILMTCLLLSMSHSLWMMSLNLLASVSESAHESISLLVLN